MQAKNFISVYLTAKIQKSLNNMIEKMVFALFDTITLNYYHDTLFPLSHHLLPKIIK